MVSGRVIVGNLVVGEIVHTLVVALQLESSELTMKKLMVSAPANAFASCIAALRVHSFSMKPSSCSMLTPVQHSPFPGLLSTLSTPSFVELTKKVDAAWTGLAAVSTTRHAAIVNAATSVARALLPKPLVLITALLFPAWWSEGRSAPAPLYVTTAAYSKNERRR